jgi:hypothetical protein
LFKFVSARARPLFLVLSTAACSLHDTSHRVPAEDAVGAENLLLETPTAPASRSGLLSGWNALRGDPYELDGVERFLEEGEKPACDRAAMVSYSGTTLRYYGALLVNPPFKERLARFEEVVAEVSREIYGRAPRRIRHYGSFNCRSTRNRSWVLSEHALGNALDVVGFDFAPATKESPLPVGAAPALARSFQVRVAKHWNAESGVAATHARFLALLTERLRERPDIFRSMFGPGHGGHDDHLHLDAAPYRYVDL